MELNSLQKEAVSHLSGPMLVSAGPGSGKTAVIVQRIFNLTDKYHIDPGCILTVTFTRAAANEMAERYRKLSAASAAFPTFGTFHSVFFNILKSCGYSESCRIITGSQKQAFLRSEINRYNLDHEDSDQLILSLSNDISRFKNSLFERTGDMTGFIPSLTDEDTFRFIFNDYGKMLGSGHMIDLDDILVRTFLVISEKSDILDLLRRKYRFYLIDEFQDINRIQYDTVRMLASPENNIFAVGDDDQNIYSFRSALKNACHVFLSDYPGCKHVPLNINYRSNKDIIDISGRLIANNTERIPKNITGVKHSNIRSVFINSFSDQHIQYEAIANSIISLSETIPFDQIAVLNRNSRYIPDISRIMTDRNIPINAQNISPGSNDHFTAKDIFSYFRLSQKHADRSDVLRIINRPERNISRSAVSGNTAEECISGMLDFYASDHEIQKKIILLIRQLAFLKRLPPAAGIEFIMNAVCYRDYLKSYALSRNEDPDLYFKKISEIKTFAARTDSIEQLLKLAAYDKERSVIDHDKYDGVRIMTVHASKGLEFDTVFIPDLNKGLFPPGRIKDPVNIYEERRLLYVAMTRAASRLYISYSDRILGKKTEPSMFIRELEGTIQVSAGQAWKQ